MARETERCGRCGSDRIIRGVELQDTFGDTGIRRRQAEVKVEGDPNAWVFKDSAYGRISLDICGACGRAEIQVNGFEELWQKAQQSPSS